MSRSMVSWPDLVLHALLEIEDLVSGGHTPPGCPMKKENRAPTGASR
jgi:hypothetical protein